MFTPYTTCRSELRAVRNLWYKLCLPIHDLYRLSRDCNAEKPTIITIDELRQNSILLETTKVLAPRLTS